MIKYFPKREDVEGFTKTLRDKVKERLLNDPYKEQQTTLQLVEPTVTIHRPRVGVGHWANRGFEEYKKAA